MTKKQLQKAFERYRKKRELKPLTNTLKDLLLYMAENARIGYDLEFLNTIPLIVEFLNTLDLKEGRK